MAFDVNAFHSHINRSGGLATPSKFRMLISGGILKNSKARAIAMQINQAHIPGRSLATNNIRTHGPIRKAPYGSVYDDLQISVYCTNDNLFPRDLFEDWQNAIFDVTTSRLNYFDQYVSDLEVEQMDEKGNVVFACKFVDAYPMMVAPLSLDWSQTNSVQNLQVTFAYRKWHIHPLTLNPFGSNLAINGLFPNFDIGGTVDRFSVAVLGRADGQFVSGAKKAGQFLGNIF